MNDLNKITPMEFDSIVPVDDLCMAAGLVCISQRKNLRHYDLGNGKELTVNNARNEWAMKNPDCYGSASQLAVKLGLADNSDFSKAFAGFEKLYAERENTPAAFGYTAVSRPVWDFTDTCHPKDRELGMMMTRYGLSMDTVKLYALEGSLPQVKGNKQERVLAMPVGEEADCFMAFNGKMFRQIGEGGMSAVGQRRKDQICMVYENPLDFLTLMESATRNGAYPLMARRYHIIINGKRGLAEACEYLKANPDFLEGTAIDRTDMYSGFGSLFAKHLPKVPETYRKWKSMRIEVEEKETRNVRQKQPKPKLDITPLLGGEKKAVIDRETGGLKL